VAISIAARIHHRRASGANTATRCGPVFGHDTMWTDAGQSQIVMPTRMAAAAVAVFAWIDARSEAGTRSGRDVTKHQKRHMSRTPTRSASFSSSPIDP
jgi:hypothetical protein